LKAAVKVGNKGVALSRLFVFVDWLQRSWSDSQNCASIVLLYTTSKLELVAAENAMVVS